MKIRTELANCLAECRTDRYQIVLGLSVPLYIIKWWMYCKNANILHMIPRSLLSLGRCAKLSLWHPRRVALIRKKLNFPATYPLTLLNCLISYCPSISYFLTGVTKSTESRYFSEPKYIGHKYKWIATQSAYASFGYYLFCKYAYLVYTFYKWHQPPVQIIEHQYLKCLK